MSILKLFVVSVTFPKWNTSKVYNAQNKSNFEDFNKYYYLI